jgi:type IV pilus assembly protein PilA
MRPERPPARPVDDPDAGFTLIELMMVVLIIAILIAVLIPTFLGANRRANDRAMQSSLRNAITAAKTVYTDKQDYTLATAAALNAEGVPVKFVNASTAPAGQNEISVDPVSATRIVFGGASKSGTCFFVSDDALGAGTQYASGPGTCAASSAPAAGNAAWKWSW